MAFSMNCPRAFVLFLLLQVSLTACAFFEGPPAPPPAPDHLQHTVTFPGETLGLIASWYTGASTNWRELKDFNAEIDLKRIRTGDRITIPERLLVRREPMPKSFVRSFYRSKVSNEPAGDLRSGVHENTILVDPSGDDKAASVRKGNDQGHDELLLKLLEE